MSRLFAPGRGAVEVTVKSRMIAADARVPSSELEPAVANFHPALVPVVVAHHALSHWKGLRRCFTQKEGFILVPAQESAGHLLMQCRKLAPCVLIVGEQMLDSFDAAELASTADFGRSIRVLVVGAKKDDRIVHTFVRMGCMGFIGEDASPSTLKRAVRALARGEIWLERRLTASVIQQLLCSLSSQKLTPREREILRLIAAGLKNRAIAEKLSISHETVRWHIRSLHSKLGLQDRLGTALYAQTYLADDLRARDPQQPAKPAPLPEFVLPPGDEA